MRRSSSAIPRTPARGPRRPLPEPPTAARGSRRRSGTGRAAIAEILIEEIARRAPRRLVTSRWSKSVTRRSARRSSGSDKEDSHCTAASARTPPRRRSESPRAANAGFVLERSPHRDDESSLAPQDAADLGERPRAVRQPLRGSGPHRPRRRRRRGRGDDRPGLASAAPGTATTVASATSRSNARSRARGSLPDRPPVRSSRFRGSAAGGAHATAFERDLRPERSARSRDAICFAMYA